MHDSDRQLVGDLLNGDAAAFRRVFDGYFPRLYRFVLRRTDEDADFARDVVQAALIKGVRNLEGYRGEASLFTWLCQIARRELLDQQAKRVGEQRRLVRMEEDPSVRATLESMEWVIESDPEKLIERRDLAERVHAALDYLPARYATVLEQKYVEDRSVDEIAREMGLTSISVQSLLARARSAFREACQALAGADGGGLSGAAK